MISGVIQKLKHRFEVFLNRSGHAKDGGRDLEKLIRSLEETLAGVEPRFLELGDSFQALFEETRIFSDLVGETIDLASGESADATLTGTESYARDCVERLKTIQKGMLESLAVFEKVEKGLEELEKQSAGAEKIVLLLKVIVLNIGIESNRAKESAEMFQSFIGEVRDLSAHVDEVIRSLHHDSEAIRKDHRKTVEEIRNHVSRLTRLADRADQELKEAARQIEAMMAKTLGSLTANRESGRAMERHLGDIVMALQMHDIIRQRIDAVVRDLRCTETLIRDSGETGVESGAVVLVKEAGQLEGVVFDVDRTCREVALSFKGIERHLAELYRDVGERVRESRDLKAGNDPFSLLAASLKSLCTLMEESISLGRVVDDRILEASDKVQALSGYVKSVESISLDLQRKALNAIIKAAHLGEMGRGIEVFAREVGTASQTSTRFAEKVVASISGIRQMVESLQKNSVEGDRSALTSHLLSGSEKILQAFERFRDNADNVALQFEKIEAIIGRAESELLFFEEFSDELNGYVSGMRSLAEGMAGKALDFSSPRTLEAGIFDGVAVSAAAALVLPPDGEDPAGDNPESPVSPDEASDSEPDREPVQNRDNGDGLGDNVELF